MATNKGKVKFFSLDRGYGFLQPEDGGKDVFVHVTAVEKSGLKTLPEGAAVEYDLETHKGRTAAVNLKVVG